VEVCIILRLSGTILTICFFTVFSVQVVTAAVYKYVDAQGRLSFTNVPVTSRFRYYQAEPGESKHPHIAVTELIKHYAKMYRLDSNLIRAVVRAESNFDSRAVSPRGAMGLMQLHPLTINDLAVIDPFNPSENIAGGTKYLRQMLNRFNGDLDLALAAYNSGPATVERYNGIPPYPETKKYVEKVKYYLQLYRQGGS